MAQALVPIILGHFPSICGSQPSCSCWCYERWLLSTFATSIQLPSRDEYPCHVKQWPTSTSQLHLSRSPRLIPAIVPTNLPDTVWAAASSAESVIARMNTDVMEAQDNLLQSKIFQEHYANSNRGAEFTYKVGDMVMLSTFHRRREFRKKGDKCSAKFFPHWDGPYKVIKAHAESSSYTLELPATCNEFPTY